jgi:hypothetical protein
MLRDKKQKAAILSDQPLSSENTIGLLIPFSNQEAKVWPQL